MLDHQGFDLWADGYDRSVGLSDEDGTYPFAGYRAVLNAIYNEVMRVPGARVLDIGLGTAVLTSRLYAQGCRIWGLDFSARMIAIAQEKMPGATLVQGDFTCGLPPALRANPYDFIVATYSLHHIADARKADFIRQLHACLRPGGKLLVGDVAFETRAQLEACAAACGAEWDGEEAYFVYEEIARSFNGRVRFERFSPCAGVLTWER